MTREAEQATKRIRLALELAADVVRSEHAEAQARTAKAVTANAAVNLAAAKEAKSIIARAVAAKQDDEASDDNDFTADSDRHEVGEMSIDTEEIILSSEANTDTVIIVSEEEGEQPASIDTKEKMAQSFTSVLASDTVLPSEVDTSYG